MGAIVKIALINLLLSSDNVLVIALFSKGLAKSKKIFALSASMVASVILQLGILFVVAFLFHISFLQMLFGVLICYMAVKLLNQKKTEVVDKKPNSTWYTIGKIVIGNLMMSFENEATLITLSGGNVWIAWIGVLVTSPIIFFGSHLITVLLEKYDFILYIGSIVLFKIGLGLFFTLPAIASVAKMGSWGLTILYGVIVLAIYLKKRGILHGNRPRV